MKCHVFDLLVYFSIAVAVHSSAADELGLGSIMTKLDILQASLQNIEQHVKLQDHQLDALERALAEVKRNMKEREETLQRKLTELESNMKANNTMMEATGSMKKLQHVVKMTEQTLQAKLTALEETVQSKNDTLQEVLRTLKGMKASFHDQIGVLRNKTIEKKNDLPVLVGFNNSIQNISFNGLQAEAEPTIGIQTKMIKNEPEILVTTPSTPATRPKRILAYRSCKEVSTNVSAKYQIKIPDSSLTVQVYCEQEAFGGGWTVFQHRFNGEVDFFRNWSEYREGFGDLDGEFWFGLEYLHELTSVRRNELMIEVQDYKGNYGYERYKEFKIGSESDKYSLKIGGYKGTAGDSLFYHQGMKFSTKDSDNDASDKRNCAEATGGAWWYNACSESNLNGPYANTTNDWKSLHWRSLKDDGRAMIFSRMMFRAVN